MVQSGSPHTFWPFAVKYVCFARNNQPCAKLNGVTLWFARTKAHYDGPKLPFGCLVSFMPPEEADLRLKFDANMQPGIYLSPYLGVGAKWSKDVSIS